ncbi:MAG TPA: mechanosensitive ion channel domain-containing protein [Chloroflexota bacterium]
MRLVLALQAVPTATPQQAPDLPTIQDWLAMQWPAVVQALLVILATLVALRIAQGSVVSAMRRARVDTGTQILVRRGLSIAIVVVGTVFMLGILGANAAGLVTVVGAVGLAFSLAIQDILKNFFSGVYLLLERPFRVGDTIRIKDQVGVVENIGVRTTTLRTVENVQVLVPNALVFAEIVANHSRAAENPAVGSGPQGPV